MPGEIRIGDYWVRGHTLLLRRVAAGALIQAGLRESIPFWSNAWVRLIVDCVLRT